MHTFLSICFAALNPCAPIFHSICLSSKVHSSLYVPICFLLSIFVYTYFFHFLCLYWYLFLLFFLSLYVPVFSIFYLCIGTCFYYFLSLYVPVFSIFYLCMYLCFLFSIFVFVPVFTIFYLYIGTCFFYFLSLYWYLFLLFSIFECKCVFQSFVSWTFSISACNSFLFLFLHSSNAFKKIPLRRNFSQYINPFTVLNKMNSIPRRRFICADFSFTCMQLMCFFFLFSSFLSCS